VHRVRILYEAAKALVGLCRYKAAEFILNQLLSIANDHAAGRILLVS
jgi:thiamine monophosphate synthase